MENSYFSLKEQIIKSWKYIVIIVFISQTLPLLTCEINYTNSKFINADLNKYLKMAEAAPNFDYDIIKPFVYRIIIPWLAGIMPFSIAINFFLINQLGLLLLSLTIFIFFLDNNLPIQLSFILTIIFQLNRYFFLFNTWNYFQALDVLSLAILFLSFVLLKHKKWLILFFLLPISILIKEYILIFFPAAFFYLILQKEEIKNLLRMVVLGCLSFLVFILIRQLITAEGGESLWVQYSTQVIYYSKPQLLIKRFIVPFTPFGLIPLIFFKDTFRFLKQNIHFFIFIVTVIIISFFGEPERLLAPISSIYLLLIGNIIIDMLGKKERPKKILIFYTFLLIISFIGSFYHLWGIILLPNRELAMYLTLFVNIIIPFLFIYFRYSNKSST